MLIDNNSLNQYAVVTNGFMVHKFECEIKRVPRFKNLYIDTAKRKL